MQQAIIPFENVNLITIKDEETGEIFVALRPITEGLGLRWSGQHAKLKRLKEEGVQITEHPVKTKGGTQKMLFIRLYDLPAYLYSINISKVKPELKPKLLKFKRETTKVINDYWNKNSLPQVPEYLMYGNVVITPKRAEILEKVAKFINEVRKTNPVKAIRMMNKFLKNLGEQPEPLPIPPEKFLPDEDWLTVREIATYFGVSQSAVRDWIRKRKIQAIKYKGLYFIPRDEFIFFARYRKRPVFPKPEKKKKK